MRLVGIVLSVWLVNGVYASADILFDELSCSKVNPNKLINFFNKDIKDKIIDVTPDFCSKYPKSNSNENAFNQLFSALKKRSDKIHPAEPIDNEPFLIAKSLLLNKFWNHLTNKQRHFVFGYSECTKNREIYQGFMDFKDEKRTSSSQDKIKSEKTFETYRKICAIDKFEQLIPYFDKGLLLEYFFVVNLAKLNFKFHEENFCKSINNHQDNFILGSRALNSKFNYSRFKKNIEWMLKTDLYNRDSYRRELSNSADTRKVNPRFLQAIRDYTAANYVDINNCLRGKMCVNNSIEQITQINKGLSAIKRKEMITYRGVSRLPERVERKLKPNCIFSDPAFSSTSLRYEVARSFLRSDEGYMFVIRGKSGALIQDLSTIRDEEEVLYPAGTRFVIVGKRSNFEVDTQKEIRIIYLREVEPFEKIKDCVDSN